MALAESLLSAIVRADGDALVMHVGEKPYVVVGKSPLHISTHELTLDTTIGMMTQLLPAEVLVTLEEFGAVEYRLPDVGDDRFNIVAARGGDDIWIEIRRRRNQSTAAVAVSDEQRHVAEAAAEQERRVAAELAAEEQRGRAIALEQQRLADEAIAAREKQRLAEAAAEEERRVAAQAAAAAAAEAEARRVAAEAAAAEEQRRLAAEAEELRRVAEDERRRAAEAAAAEDERRRAAEAAAAEDERRRAAEAAAAEDERRRAAEAAAAEEERRRAAEAAAEEERRRAAEAAAEEERRRAAEAAAAEEERRRAEAAAAEDERRRAAEAAAEEERRTADEQRRLAAAVAASAAIAAAQEERRRAAEAAEVQRRLAAEAAAAEDGRRRAAEAAEEERRRAAEVAAHEERRVIETAPEAESVEAAYAHEKSDELRRDSADAAFGREGERVVIPMTRTVRIEVPPRGAGARSTDIERLLRIAAARGASGLFLTSESRPYIRVDGDIRQLDSEALLSRTDVEAAIVEIAPEKGREQIGKGEVAEWLKEYPELGRIRCTTFSDHRGPGLLLRIIATRAATAEQLGLSREVQALATESQGLVLVAGPRTSGKSTLMSALVDLVNRQRAEFVITLERQIRLVHDNKAALVSQREIRGGADEALAAARSALREGPDVLVIDDLISPHMVPLILTAVAEGLLVFVSMTAPSTSDAVQRFIELATPEMRGAVQNAMTESFRGAVAQVLLKKTGGGLVAAREVLLATAPVTRVIAEGQLAQLPHALESGRKHGMVSFTETLIDYVRSGTVDVREAFRKAPDRERLLAGLKREKIDTSLVERLA
jgi:twitching motility protein PilT